MKKLLTFITCLLMLVFVVSCDKPTEPVKTPTQGGETQKPTENKALTDADLFAGLDFNMSASLDVMVWSGDGNCTSIAVPVLMNCISSETETTLKSV